MNRKKVKFFVSYAHRNKEIACSFLERLKDVIKPSKNYDYSLWDDSGLVVGEDWKKQILEHRDNCDFGLLLVSPAYLASEFISENELPEFVSGSKPSIPVLIQPVDFSLHDLKGLESRQIFRLNYEGFKEPRSYGECRKQRRDTFIMELFRVIEKKLAQPSNE